MKRALILIAALIWFLCALSFCAGRKSIQSELQVCQKDLGVAVAKGVKANVNLDLCRQGK